MKTSAGILLHTVLNIQHNKYKYTKGKTEEEKVYGRKTLYNQVKYTMQHGEETKTLHVKFLFGRWAINPACTHTKDLWNP